MGHRGRKERSLRLFFFFRFPEAEMELSCLPRFPQGCMRRLLLFGATELLDESFSVKSLNAASDCCGRQS